VNENAGEVVKDKVPQAKGGTKAPGATDASKDKAAAVAATPAPAMVPLPAARPDVPSPSRKKYRRYYR
jgi:hypothetical protein